MSKRDRSASGGAVFYKSITNAQEIRSGYLLKSPPQMRLKSEWKRRFFVLYKTPENDHQLRYYRYAEDRVNPLGGIDMTQISLLYANPEHHQKWQWVQKSFKCSPSCVVFLRAANRDYFLIGETSSEADGWFTDLFEALKNRPHKFLKSEEISNGQPVIDIISSPLQRGKFSAPELKVPFLVKKEEDENDTSKISLPFSVVKIRSFSDPPSKAAGGNTEELVEDNPRRPTSEPVNHIYDYPKSCRKGASALRAGSMESLYESMAEFKSILNASEPNDREVEVIVSGSLMRSISDVYTKYKAEESPAPLLNEASAEKGDDNRQSSDSSTSCSFTVSPDILEANLGRRGSTRSLEAIVDMREFMVNLQDLKNDLTLTEVEGKPSVCGWTGEPQSVCLFHKGDRVMAINDLQTDSMEDFYMFIRKSMKDEVKVTVQRQRGSQPLHWPNSPCSD